MQSCRKPMYGCACFWACLLVFGVHPARASSINFGGLISQSTQDGTGPAVNNPSLNNIQDGDHYTLAVNFSAYISSPGTYALTSASLKFSDPSAGASEASFGGAFPCAGHSASACLTASADGAYYDISLLACLTTGSGCAAGNQLDLNFKILAASANSQNITALPIFGLTPLDLLEDDGVTDIQGSLTSYSNSAVPEPSSVIPLLGLFAWIMVNRLNKEGEEQQ